MSPIGSRRNAMDGHQAKSAHSLRDSVPAAHSFFDVRSGFSDANGLLMAKSGGGKPGGAANAPDGARETR